MQKKSWYHLYVSWRASTPDADMYVAPDDAKFYRDGVQVQRPRPQYINHCRALVRRGGEYMTLTGIQKHKEMEKYADRGEMHISVFALWNRILTDEEIREIAKSCQGYTKGNPVVIWDDFVESCKENAESALINPSTCQA